MLNFLRAFWASALYIAAVVAPNILIDRFGIVDVVPGPWTLMAPAAVYAVGVALVARDVVDDILGLTGVLAAIGLGTILSVLLADPTVALASGVAFVLAELLDLGIYRRLVDRGWIRAALVSSYVGAGFDSLVFLWLAFGSLAFLPGQWVGKAVSVTVVVLIAGPLRRYWSPASRRREPVPA